MKHEVLPCIPTKEYRCGNCGLFPKGCPQGSENKNVSPENLKRLRTKDTIGCMLLFENYKGVK